MRFADVDEDGGVTPEEFLDAVDRGMLEDPGFVDSAMLVVTDAALACCGSAARSTARGATTLGDAWPSSRPPATCCAPRTSPTRATSSRSASTTSPSAAGLSRAHFSREFRAAFGESPHAYLLTRRLERAAALLRTTDRSVADVCFSVGLQSVGSFTTSFTRTYGKSPLAYREAFPPAADQALVPGCVVRALRAARNAARFEKTTASAPD